MSRVILIGDLHGCAFEAQALLEACKATDEDHVVFLGDLLDRGPDNDRCVDLAMKIEARQGKPACIMGNHEEKHLDYEDVLKRLGRLPSQMPPTHVATRDQLEPHHYEYLRRLPLYLRFPEHNAVAVHAGVWPGRPIEEQTARHLLHVQMIRPYDSFGNPYTHKDAEKSVWSSKVPHGEDGWKFWTHFWKGPEKVVFGHSVLNKPLVLDHAVGIDGGAVFGRELWAYVMETGVESKIVSVKGHGKDDPSDLQRRGNPDRKVITIHGDVGTY